MFLLVQTSTCINPGKNYPKKPEPLGSRRNWSFNSQCVQWKQRKEFRTHKESLTKCYSLSKLNSIDVKDKSVMSEIYDFLSESLYAKLDGIPPNKKYFVGLAGPPGSGKSTVSQEVVKRILTKFANAGGVEEDIAVSVPMDGFHLYRWQLDQFEDPKEAHARRGAPWTFDPKSLLQKLSSLKNKGFGKLPSFDHGVGDPIEDDISVELTTQIVIVEGNYLLLDSEDWRDLAPLFDEKWFIDVDLDEAMKRVEKRHVATGKSEEIAKKRVSYNDRPNAELIMETKSNADLVIPSLPLNLN